MRTKEEIAAYKKKWRAVNKERVSVQRNQYYMMNKDKILDYQKKYYTENKEKVDAYKKQHYAAHKEKVNAYRKKYYGANKETSDNYQKQYRLMNKEKTSMYNKQYRLENKEKCTVSGKQYREANKEKMADYGRDRYKNNRAARIMCNLRSRVRVALKGINKSAATIDLIGCNQEELKKHLESQFKEGMCWDNHGRYGWHLDHIKPCISFNLVDPEEQKKCFHYTNLQPLWAAENMSKGAKLTWTGI